MNVIFFRGHTIKQEPHRILYDSCLILFFDMFQCSAQDVNDL